MNSARATIAVPSDMHLQRLKMIICAAWAAIVVALAVVFDLSGIVALAVAALGLLPPLALLMLWNEPQQTMSETINQARR